jgi:hypothetical protein
MKVELLLNDCNGQVLLISEGNHKDSSQFYTLHGNNLTTWHTRARKAPRVGTVHDDYQRVEPGTPYPSVVFHVYASADTPWVAQTLSHCTLVKYGGVSSNSTTVEATQFAWPQKIPYAPVHNSNLLTGARRSVLNRHRWGLPPRSFKHENILLPDLPIWYSLQPPSLPAGLNLNHSINYSSSELIPISNQGIKTKSHEWNLPLYFYWSTIR